MENATSMGLNRTGLQMSPLSKDDMIDFAKAKAPLAPPDNGEMQALHLQYIEEADALGSVPLPGTLKGAASTGMDKLKGSKPEVLIDKLGERLAFERTGTRLYEALILKCSAVEESASSNGHSEARSVAAEFGVGVGQDVGRSGSTAIDLQRLHTIRNEEENHFQMVRRAMMTLGADPTAMTPCADAAGVSSMGLLQTISDPATSVPQCLNAILIAELADNAGWELLIELAAAGGHTQMAKEFATALDEERIHLETVKGWLREAVLAEAS
jgi:hypothetical protein